MLIETQELKKTIIDDLTQARELSKRVGANKGLILAFDAKIRTLETILVALAEYEKKGELDMEKLKIGLGKTITLDELLAGRQTGGKVQQAILEEAGQLKPGEARPIDTKAVNGSTFINTVYTMRQKGKLPPDIKPMQDKKTGSYYLVRLKAGD